jgi:ArsR family transcriptional regulator
MNARTQARYEARARILKALAHPTRLFLVDELSRAEHCVADLTRMVGADMSTVSRHLARLQAIGILRSERRGTEVYYRLRIPCVLRFFGCIEAVIRETAREQLRLAR